MNRPVTALALIAAGLTPALHAEDAIKGSLTGTIQIRGEYANAYQDNAGPYAPSEGANAKTDHFDFYLRRARLGAKFESTSKQWSGSFILRADRADQVSAATSSAASRTPVLHQVFVSRNFQNSEGTVKYAIQAGLDYAFFNRADLGPSGANLLPTQRATHSLSATRGTGIGFRTASKEIKFGVDIQNNTGDGAPSSKTEREGLWYSTRIELSPPESTNWNIDKYQETWAGAEGQGLLLGIEVGYNQKDYTAAANTPVNGPPSAGDTLTDTLVVGGDLLFRWNGLVALAEARWQRMFAHTNWTTGPLGGQNGNSEASSVIYIIQAGYALPTDFISEGSSSEVAVRWTYRDAVRENRSTEASLFGTQDYGNSGQSYEFGLTYYDLLDMAKDGKGNKTGIVYTNWHAESGSGKAHIFRIQHQVAF
ncbi:hypothetical protein LBMAG53_29580 [Planctomycetota bacterium]|nr:hypothetical protein LBMAG53_29580 [Planctomycetota bacterium]